LDALAAGWVLRYITRTYITNSSAIGLNTFNNLCIAGHLFRGIGKLDIQFLLDKRMRTRTALSSVNINLEVLVGNFGPIFQGTVEYHSKGVRADFSQGRVFVHHKSRGIFSEDYGFQCNIFLLE